MKIAFVGKGGSGKTTLASLFTRRLAARGRVLAIDADINQHLAEALGADEAEARALPALGDHLELIKDWLRGSNPLIGPGEMVKTTPPGNGSRLLRVDEQNPIYDACVREVAGVRLAVTGPFADDDIGVACYHGKSGAAELVLSHLIDGPGDYVVVDTTAGADSVASGLIARFDLVAVVVEPTTKSVSVWHQLADHSRDFGTPLVAVANKVEDDTDRMWLRDHLGVDPLTHVGRSAHVRAAERGEVRPVGDLEPDNLAALDALAEALDATPKDWQALQADAEELHRRNAKAWANERAGTDLTDQIDATFVLGRAARNRHSPSPNRH